MKQRKIIKYKINDNCITNSNLNNKKHNSGKNKLAEKGFKKLKIN